MELAGQGASPVLQRLRGVCLPMQGPRVQSTVGELRTHVPWGQLRPALQLQSSRATAREKPACHHKEAEGRDDRSQQENPVQPSKWARGASVKNPPANAGDTRETGSIPGSGSSLGRGHGSPLRYSCLENPTDRGAWRAAVHAVAKSQTRLRNHCFHFFPSLCAQP